MTVTRMATPRGPIRTVDLLSIRPGGWGVDTKGGGEGGEEGGGGGGNAERRKRI